MVKPFVFPMGKKTHHSVKTSTGQYNSERGVLAKIPRPFSMSRGSSLWLLTGVHTPGNLRPGSHIARCSRPASRDLPHLASWKLSEHKGKAVFRGGRGCVSTAALAQLIWTNMLHSKSAWLRLTCVNVPLKETPTSSRAVPSGTGEVHYCVCRKTLCGHKLLIGEPWGIPSVLQECWERGLQMEQ